LYTPFEKRAMELALREALKGGKAVFPNPMVGAVILNAGGDVVSSGHHACCGAPHAERDALSKAGDVRGMTMVVTLEPCCHHGRTPPCAEALAEAGIKRVVAAMVDPDPQVSGRGIEYLRSRGVDVSTGLMEEAARDLNRVYLHHRETGRSFLHLKMAGTLDGMCAAADGSSRWITGPVSRKTVHGFRRDAHAVLIGAGTALADDPSLVVSEVECHPADQPVRIVLTGEDLREGLRMFTLPGRTVVACDRPVKAHPSAEMWTGIASPGELLKRTAEEGLGLVLCEGGPVLAASLVRARLVDRLSIFTSPSLLGGEGRPIFGELGIPGIDGMLRLKDVTVRESGEDMLTEGRIVYRAD